MTAVADDVGHWPMVDVDPSCLDIVTTARVRIEALLIRSFAYSELSKKGSWFRHSHARLRDPMHGDRNVIQ